MSGTGPTPGALPGTIGAASMQLALAQVADALGAGARLVGDGARRVARVCTDTRSLKPGDLFVALAGERYDAHDFLPQARATGAAGAIAQRGLAESGLDGVLVADTLQALQGLAAWWRGRFDLPVIAVAGSNGKTTVTQMIASILRAAHGEAAHATAGNFNNHIGVPLTVLALRPGHRAAVVELGMNHPGEIAGLARIAQPTVALVNNAQREHQEFMASVEAVARENGAAIEALPAGGVAVFPADDPQAPVWEQQAGARRCLRFALVDEGKDQDEDQDEDRTGPRPPADVKMDVEVEGRTWWTGQAWTLELRTAAGRARMRLAVAGRHNVRNALAATAAALAAGVPLEAVVRGLQDFRPVRGRSQPGVLQRAGRARILVDDTYNANPDSVRAAIDVLAGLPGPRWLVLGDMGEVGDQGPAFHAEVGAYAAARGIEHFWCAGAACTHAAAAYGARACHFADAQALRMALAAGLAEPDFESVLVKGSRFMAMERIVADLQGRADARPDEAGGGHAA